MQTRFWICLSFIFLLTGWVHPVYAFTSDQARQLVDERLYPATRPTDQDLLTDLEYQVSRYLALGRTKPAYFQTGIMGGFLLFGYPGEGVTTLVESLPFLSPALQTQVKSYLASEIRSQDPTSIALDHCQSGWGSCELSGTRRENYRLPIAPNPDPIKPNVYPAPKVPPEALYMLWSYAERTGDWAFLSTTTPPSGDRWKRLQSLFAAIPNTPSRYGEVSGAIGYARILAHFGQTNGSEYARAVNLIQSGLSQPTLANFKNAYDHSSTLFTNTFGMVGHDWSFPPFHYIRQANVIGFHFAPEIGRFLSATALSSVNTVVTKNPLAGQTGQVAAIEEVWPEWYLYRAPYPETRSWTGHYGENHYATPDVPWALFMIHAYVYTEATDALRMRLGAPYSQQDLTYIQKLTATIYANAGRCWGTTSSTCSQISSPLPTSTPTAEPASCLGDIDSSRSIDVTDYTLLVRTYLRTPLLSPRADLDGNGAVDLTDYSLLVQRFLRPCE